MRLTNAFPELILYCRGSVDRLRHSGAEMSNKQRKRKELRRLQASLLEIATLLDAIEGRPHPLLRKSADRLTPPAAAPPSATLADYTQHFAATLAKSRTSVKG